MLLASVLVSVVGGLMFGCSLYLPLFQQIVQGVTATESGLLLLPMLIPMMLASQVPGVYMTRTGRYKLFPIIGTVTVTVGTLLLATMDTSTSSLTTSLYMIVVGTGLGFFLQMTTTIAQNSVDLPDMGAATAAIALFRTLGGSVAVAIFGALSASALIGIGGPATGAAYLAAVAAGARSVFLAASALGAVGIVAALLIKEVPLRSASGS
jgi:hypothetical protein